VLENVPKKDLVALGFSAGIVDALATLHKKKLLSAKGEFYVHEAITAGVPLSTLAPLGVTEKQYEEAKVIAAKSLLAPSHMEFLAEYEATYGPRPEVPSGLISLPYGQYPPWVDLKTLPGAWGELARWTENVATAYEEKWGEGSWAAAKARGAASGISLPLRAVEPRVTIGDRLLV